MAFNPMQNNQDDIQAEINIVPLTDVFLVLLIIFMVTSTAINSNGVAVELPTTGGQSQDRPSQGVTLTMTSEGQVLINAQQVAEANLGAAIRAELEKAQTKTVILEGDTRAQLGTAVRVMDIAKGAGAQEIAIATRQ